MPLGLTREVTMLERELEHAHRVLLPFLGLRPSNAREEHVRLASSWAAGSQTEPHWTYDLPETSRAAEALRRADTLLGGIGTHPLLECYGARLLELSTELTIISCAGSKRLASPSQIRFALDASNARTANEWASLGFETGGASIGSIAREVRSLVGKLRLPFRVEETDHISALAATGEDVIYVARDRQVSEHVARRTAVHEVYGHAVPRTRARAQSLLLFRFGTASGHDDQEGYALLREDEHGLFDLERKREIGIRWQIVRNMRAGATFVDTVRDLLARHFTLESALRLASRIYRGSDGKCAGVGRESAYLEGYARLARASAVCSRIVAHGQVGCAWTGALAEFVNYLD